MKLNLKNPLVFLDLETTGINVVTDRIVEIALLKIFPDGREEEKLQRINPGMPIPVQASAIHGIYDEDVKDAPVFKEVPKYLPNLLRVVILQVLIQLVSIFPYSPRSFFVWILIWISKNINLLMYRSFSIEWRKGHLQLLINFTS